MLQHLVGPSHRWLSSVPSQCVSESLIRKFAAWCELRGFPVVAFSTEASPEMLATVFLRKCVLMCLGHTPAHKTNDGRY